MKQKIYSIIAMVIFSLFLTLQVSAEEREKRNSEKRNSEDQKKKRGSKEEMTKRILKHDKNNDGKITKEEWRGPARLFTRFDKDGDGTLTQKEIESRGGGMRQQQGMKQGTNKSRAGNMKGSSRLERYEKFPTVKPMPGDLAPEFELKDLKGNKVSLKDLLKTKPVVIETGSYTCPVFRKRHSGIEELHKKYSDKVHLVVLYGREAHAGSLKFKAIKQPQKNDERTQLAQNAAKELSIDVPVVVDDVDNKVTTAYGGLPNCGYIIGQDGRVFYKLSWIHPSLMQAPLAELIKRGGSGGQTPQVFPVGGNHPSESGQARVLKPTVISLNKIKDAPTVTGQEAKNQIAWAGNDIDKAIAIAKKASVPVLVEFHFEGCGVCAAMEKGPLADPKVVAVTRKYVTVKVDITTDEGEKTAEHYKVVGTPTFVILQPDGKVAAKRVGHTKSEIMINFLQAGLQTGVAGKEKRSHDKPATISLLEMHDQYEHFSWVSNKEKEDWDGFLLKPKGDGPFPVLIANHAGMMSADRLVQRQGKNFANEGFVVIGCNLGHNGKYKTWKNPGASDQNVYRVLTALAIIKTLPYVDQDKINIYGHSMGGFCTLGVLARKEAAAIRVAAISGSGIQVDNLKTGSRNIGIAAPDAKQAARIKTPLLMIHADDDRTVPLECQQALKKILDKNKIPNTFILRKGAGHRGVAGGKPDNMKEIVKFFKSHWEKEQEKKND